MSYDPLSQYTYGQTGIPQGYTTGLENFGFMGAPFGSVEQNFAAQDQFQQLMKSMLDTQIGAFNNGNNIRALPFNLRSMFNSAAPLLTDPMYGLLGAPGFFSNGYQSGALPNNPSWAHRAWAEQAAGYPNYPAPQATSPFGAPSWAGQNQSAQSAPQSGGGGGGGGSFHVGQYTVPLQGGGSITVNASNPQSAWENAGQQGNHPDTSGQLTTIHQPYVG